MNIDRDFLKFLAEYPIGNRELQAEADRCSAEKGLKPGEELKATIKRVNAKWLPKGKRTAKPAEPVVQQIDIEDAVEERGGKRGASHYENGAQK